MIERDTCMDRERDQRYRERKRNGERWKARDRDDVRDIQIATDRKTDRQ